MQQSKWCAMLKASALLICLAVTSTHARKRKVDVCRYPYMAAVVAAPLSAESTTRSADEPPPYVVSKGGRRLRGGSAGSKSKCAGVIIRENMVVTACRCVAVRRSDQIVYRPVVGSYVVAGKDMPMKRAEGGQTVDVYKFLCHERYNKTAVKSVRIFDTAIVVLDDVLALNKAVQPIAFEDYAEGTAAAEFDRLAKLEHECETPGYDSKGRLATASMRIMTRKLCAETSCKITKKLCGLDFKKSGLACAYAVKPDLVCRPKHGSPLVCDGRLYGLLSAPFGCRPNTTGLYGDVSAVLNVLHAIEDEIFKPKDEMPKDEMAKGETKKERGLVPPTSRAAGRADVFSVILAGGSSFSTFYRFSIG
ncbi:unnamed protein product, partial [Nesidiocoris tenuis]